MIPISRMYETESQARDAVRKLIDAKCREDLVFLIAPPGGSQPAPAVSASQGEDAGDAPAAPPPAPAATGSAPSPDELVAMVRSTGTLPRSRAVVYSRNLAEGRWLVVAAVHVLMGVKINQMLDECGPIDKGGLALVKDRNPSPFSDLIGMSTLEKGNGMSFMTPFGRGLTKNPNWTFSSMLGLPLLSEKAAPLSSMFGMKVLSEEKAWKTSFGMPLLTNQNRGD